MKQIVTTGFILAIFIMLNISAAAQARSYQQHVELGNVNWLRDYDIALATAKKEKKPILLLFQEVPGCSTCQNYGKEVLTHPHIVEAIESYFVPLCVFNNLKGNDRKVLELYNEPSWNNPVVRVLGEDGKNLVKRLSGNYSSSALIQTINNGITASGSIIPEYLLLLEQELTADKAELFLAMYCFWTGEKEIAAIPGVVGTQAGFMDGREVVKVKYDKNVISAKKIKKAAAKKSCGDHLYTSDSGYRRDKDSKYYLQQSLLKHLPMTALQSTHVNRALGKKEDPLIFLSPWQIEAFNIIKKNKGKNFPNYIEEDFNNTWEEFQKL